MSYKRYNPPSPQQETQSTGSSSKRPRIRQTNSLSFISKNKDSEEARQVFGQIRKLGTTGLFEGLVGFSDEIEKLVDARLEELSELDKLNHQYPTEDNTGCSFSRLTTDHYDRLGIADPTKNKAKNTDRFIETLVDHYRNDVQLQRDVPGAINTFWFNNHQTIVDGMNFLNSAVNMTSEAACSLLICEMLLFFMKNLKHFTEFKAVLIPQFNLSSRKDKEPLEFTSLSMPSNLPEDTQNEAELPKVEVKVEKEGQTLVQRTILTGTVDYALFTTSSSKAFISKPSEKDVFKPSFPNVLSNFLLLEAKRKGLTDSLHKYIPQVIGESLAVCVHKVPYENSDIDILYLVWNRCQLSVKMLESNDTVLWCLTSGYEWIFGATKKIHNAGFRCFLLEKETIKFGNDVDLEESLKVFSLLVYFTLNEMGMASDAMIAE